MHYQSAYFIQYQTFSCPSCSPSHSRVNGLSTVIVFADDKAQALARAGRLISKGNHQISHFQRMQILHEKNQQMFGEVLKSLYGRAELYGAALHFDPFPQNPHCCRWASQQAWSRIYLLGQSFFINFELNKENNWPI